MSKIHENKNNHKDINNQNIKHENNEPHEHNFITNFILDKIDNLNKTIVESGKNIVNNQFDQLDKVIENPNKVELFGLNLGTAPQTFATALKPAVPEFKKLVNEGVDIIEDTMPKITGLVADEIPVIAEDFIPGLALVDTLGDIGLTGVETMKDTAHIVSNSGDLVHKVQEGVADANKNIMNTIENANSDISSVASSAINSAANEASNAASNNINSAVNNTASSVGGKPKRRRKKNKKTKTIKKSTKGKKVKRVKRKKLIGGEPEKEIAPQPEENVFVDIGKQGLNELNTVGKQELNELSEVGKEELGKLAEVGKEELGKAVDFGKTELNKVISNPVYAKLLGQALGTAAKSGADTLKLLKPEIEEAVDQNIDVLRDEIPQVSRYLGPLPLDLLGAIPAEGTVEELIRSGLDISTALAKNADNSLKMVNTELEAIEGIQEKLKEQVGGLLQRVEHAKTEFNNTHIYNINNKTKKRLKVRNIKKTRRIGTKRNSKNKRKTIKHGKNKNKKRMKTVAHK